jgi:hypothetical protein
MLTIGGEKNFACPDLHSFCTRHPQFFHNGYNEIPYRVMIRTSVSALACLLMLCTTCTPSAAATDATLFRLFLTDGSSLVSFGEYARVADRVIFSMPVGGPLDQPRLQVVTVPSSVVDWPRTDRYAVSARYQRYADTRGEEDFAQLTNDVARVLNEIALSTDRSRALAYAQQARQALVDWPRGHYGYRQRDVREIVVLLDESISDLRAALGISSFDIALVAEPAPELLEPLRGMPTMREQIDQVFRVAALVERPIERVSLLQSAVVMLAEAGTVIPAAEADALRRSAESAIREEQQIDARYDMLSRRLMSSATSAASRARIRDVERVLNQIPREDQRLGRRRPDTVDALRASVQEQLEAARRLRLLRDQWTIRRSLYRDYQRSVGAQLLQLVKSQPALESIRRLEGPAPPALVNLRARLAGGAERLSRVQTPEDLRSTHDLLVGAWRFAESAFNGRYDAVQSGNFAVAREASSAAAGALLLLSRAQQQLRSLLEPPRLR